MAFRMVCPKCDTMDYSIERDRRAYAHGGEAADLIYSCRCGKRMFGDAVLQEYERQKKEWASDTSARSEEDAAREAAAEEREAREAKMREALAYRSRIRAEREREEQMRREEEMRRWRERVEASGGKAPPMPPPKPRPKAKPIAKAKPIKAKPMSKPVKSTPIAKTSSPAPKAMPMASKSIGTTSVSKAAKSAKAAPAKDGVELANCAWVECEKPSRSNSKYCSRECSNKNARARHRQRKNANKSA